MTYRAICTCCGERVPRSGVWGPTFVCRNCGAYLRQNERWSRAGNRILGVLLPLTVLAGLWSSAPLSHLVGMLVPSWLTGVLAGVGFFAATALVWPYTSKYDMVDGSPLCPSCLYDLHGSPGPNCPECGRPFPSHLAKARERGSH